MIFKLSKEMQELNDKIVVAKNKGIAITRDFVDKTLKRIASSAINNQYHDIYLIVTKPRGNGITRCYYCGRKLTDGKSRLYGCGPECHKNYGDVPGRDINQPVKLYSEYMTYCIEKGLDYLTFVEWLPEKDFSRKAWAKIQANIRM